VIVLDTNVLSALMRETPDGPVVAWLDGQPAESVWVAARTRAGRPVDVRDTQIAGIVLARRAALATRNVRHFADLKLSVVDPWSQPRREAEDGE